MCVGPLSHALSDTTATWEIEMIPDLNLPVFEEVQMLPSWLVHQWLQELLRACEDDPDILTSDGLKDYLTQVLSR